MDQERSLLRLWRSSVAIAAELDSLPEIAPELSAAAYELPDLLSTACHGGEEGLRSLHLASAALESLFEEISARRAPDPLLGRLRGLGDKLHYSLIARCRSCRVPPASLWPQE